jgi:serine phosphatase RsbU (regulator of sigma subunit)/anti-sigma regulatory factor (Ser/Thr protein kinase)
VVAGSAGGTYWLVSERWEVTFNKLLLLSAAGLAAPVALQVVTGELEPYQLLFLVWVGCGAVQPARRAVVFLGVLAVAALVPVLSQSVSGVIREAVAWSVLFSAVGLVLTAYVSYVRTQRIQLRSGESDARAVAREATKRVRDLQWVTDATLSHLPLEELLGELLRRIAEALEVDGGAVLLREDARRFTQAASLGVVAVDGARPAGNITGRFPERVSDDRRSLAIEQVEGEERFEADLRQAGVRSLLGVPLPVGDEVLGVLYVATRSRRRFSEGDASFLQLVGNRVALAVERTRLFEDERQIAETLQRSLLGDILPDIPDAAIAVRYVPGRAGMEVGGDWYDVIDLRDGRVGLAIGDVVGRGLRAASLMGKLRTALEAYALDGHSPAGVLERLHHLLEGQAKDAIATVLYLVLDADKRTAEIANAGHLPPLVRDKEGTTRYLPIGQSPPLGAVPYAHFEQRQASIEPASTLILYTDGLVERRGENLQTGLEALRRAVEAGPDGPDALCEAAIARLDAGELEDDVALLAFKLEPFPDTGFSLDFPAEPEVLAMVRRVIERWLGQAPASTGDIYAIKAATMEACANAIEHAYRPGDAAFRVETTRSGPDISVTVTDFGEWRGQRGAGRGRGLALMEALMDSADVAQTLEGSKVELRRRVGERQAL